MQKMNTLKAETFPTNQTCTRRATKELCDPAEVEHALEARKNYGPHLPTDVEKNLTTVGRAFKLPSGEASSHGHAGH